MTSLYQAALLDHAKRPRNFGPLRGADRETEIANPLCGDELRVYLRLAEGRIADISFEGEGCAVCLASASMMTAATKGGTESDARDLMRRVRGLVQGAGDPASMGELAALAGVARFPARVACALLCWVALETALGPVVENLARH